MRARWPEFANASRRVLINKDGIPFLDGDGKTLGQRSNAIESRTLIDTCIRVGWGGGGGALPYIIVAPKCDHSDPRRVVSPIDLGSQGVFADS